MKKTMALFGAALVTVFSVWLLGVLNVHAVSVAAPPMHVRDVMVLGPETSVVRQQDEQPEDEPPPPEPEVMSVDLDMPAPEPMPLEPLDLNLSLPSPDHVQVQFTVAQPTPEESRPPAPQPPSPATAAKARPSVHRVSDVDQPPRESTRNPKPVYPASLKKAGIEDTVIVRLLINEAGLVERVQPLRGRPEFQQAVAEVAKDWRFVPARHDGENVKVWAVKRLRFVLRKGEA